MRDTDPARAEAELMAGLDPTTVVLDDLCRRCADLLSMQGCGLQLVTNEHVGALAASDAASRHLEDVQFTLGEGPSIEVVVTARDVLVPELVAAAGRWPRFVPVARDLGIGAAFAFVLAVDDRVGVLTAYRHDPGGLDAPSLATAHRLSRVLTRTVLGLPSGPHGDGPPQPIRDATVARAAVHQAVGIASVELGCTPEDALAVLRAHAFATGQRIDEVARAVIDRRLRFTP